MVALFLFFLETGGGGGDVSNCVLGSPLWRGVVGTCCLPYKFAPCFTLACLWENGSSGGSVRSLYIRSENTHATNCTCFTHSKVLAVDVWEEKKSLNKEHKVCIEI